MPYTDGQFLGIEWLWWVIIASGMLFIWSLTPMRAPRARRRPRSEETATLAIHSLLWVYAPTQVVNILQQQPGVRTIELDLRRGVARVAFNPRETSAAQLQNFVETCAHHCRAERAAPHSCPADLNDG